MNNKEDEEVGGIAPHWGEPSISCVFGLLCVVLFML
jgi:hypothetical protein